MSGAPGTPITDILDSVAGGRPGAKDQLWALVYDELRRMAHQQMGNERSRRTLQTTLLVNEAYLRLVGDGNVQWSNRRHFFAAAAEAMRRIRVDYARTRAAQKRGGEAQRVPVEDAEPVFDSDPAELLAIDETLDRLYAVDPRKAEVVKLRFFAGLSVTETAEALGVSTRTVESDWNFSRAWMHRELEK